jgi:dolichyl-phosphate-mannose--protein O-mannosyl transferase
MTAAPPIEEPTRTAPPSEVPAAVRDRLAGSWPDGRTSWLATMFVVVVAAVLRLVGLATPGGKMFDEVYYATEGAELIEHGVEWRPENGTGDFVVHPPLGKWLIGVGIKAFGNDEFGWRIAAVLAGVLSILIFTRLAIRLFRSVVLGATAGLLMTLDGLHFVLSRAALLDIFLMLFILAAFACLVRDRETRRARWLAAMAAGLDPAAPGRAGRPRIGVPWWRLAAAALMGCACSVKWSGLWYVILFVALALWWEVQLRRSVGARHPWLDTLLDEGGWAAAFVGVVLVVYVASWTGWFVTDTGWNRHWLANQGHDEPPVLGALRNLWQYHSEAYAFHTGLSEKHTYQSWPWQWLLLGRPVAFYWSGDGPCGADQCAAEVLLLGTPVLWWSFLPALAALAWFGIARRDWRAGAIGLGAATGILPWFWYQLDSRTMYYFYALPAEPFLILAVVYVLGAIIGPPAPPGQPVPDRRLAGVLVAGLYVLLVAANFAYFHPIYTGQDIAYQSWLSRMWLGSRWI